MQQQLGSSEASDATGLIHRVLLAESSEAPLVLLVHGRAGTCEVMWAFRRSLPEGVSILAPQAFLPDPVGGFSWWDVSEFRGAESARVTTREAITGARQRLIHFLDAALSFYQLRPRVVLALGFSQGAGLLSTVVQHEPGRFIGVGLLAGFVIKENLPERAQGSGQARARPSIFIGHGELDEVVPLAVAKEGEEFFRTQGFPTEFHSDLVGHKIGTAAMRGLKSWSGRVLFGSPQLLRESEKP
jgi:phospholipase/carboxylesterase